MTSLAMEMGVPMDTRVNVTTQWMAKVIGLALVYCLSAKLGLTLTPDGHAATAWPAAGLSLAALLVWGFSCWPGVCLGSLIASQWAPIANVAESTTASSVLIAVVVAAAATLQAVIGAHLVRRFAKLPGPLNPDREIISFLALAGPASCMIKATMVSGMLSMWGLLNVVDLGETWLGLWTADTVGVLIFAPLVLIAAAPIASGSISRRKSVLLRITASIAAALLFVFLIRSHSHMGFRDGLGSAFELLVSGLLGAFLIVMNSRATLKETLLAERMRENSELERERAARMHAENELARLATIIESTEDAIIGRTLDHHVVSWNAAAERLFGHAAVDVIGQSLCWTPPSRDGEDEELLARARRGERVDRFETERMRKNGQAVRVSVTIRPVVDSTGTLQGTLTIVRDLGAQSSVDSRPLGVDRQTDIEFALKRANKSLEEKNRRLAELYQTAYRFVDNVSHEFRTPLTVIKEFASIIRDGLVGPVNGEQSNYLEIVVGRVDDLATMVDDMLDISRLEAGVLGMCRKRERVATIVENVRPVLQRKAATSSVPLQIHMEDDLPMVFCDPEKMERVLINLVVNALKFTPATGRVELWVRHDASSERVVFGVTDTGSGIAREHLDAIFCRFKQFGGDVRAGTNGVGLGLNIARELVQLNYGEINVESELGKGSTFSFSIPIADYMGVARLCLERTRQLAEYEPFVSLIQLKMSPDGEDEKIDQFLQHLIRCEDVLFHTSREEWVLIAVADAQQAEQTILRINRAIAEASRNQIAQPLPTIEVEYLGSWRAVDQGEECLSELRELLSMKELQHA